MEDEILSELWRIKDELSEKANRVRKTKAYMIELDQLEAELFKSPYVFHDDAHNALKMRVFRKDRALGVAYLKQVCRRLATSITVWVDYSRSSRWLRRMKI